MKAALIWALFPPRTCCIVKLGSDMSFALLSARDSSVKRKVHVANLRFAEEGLWLGARGFLGQASRWEIST